MTLEQIGQGGCFAVGNYYGRQAEEVRYRDKVTGRQMSFSVVRSTIICGIKPMVVTTRIADGEPLPSGPEWPSGTVVVVRLDKMEEVRGQISASGVVSVLE